MGSRHLQLPSSVQDQLGITTSSGGQFQIDVEPCPELDLDKLKIVFDAASGKWKISPSSTINGSVAGSKRLRETSPSSTWVDNLPSTDHVRTFRDFNWAGTSLGPLESWPVSLQTLVSFLMAENVAAAIYWGPDLRVICNAEMLKVMRLRLSDGKEFMGQRFQDMWPEVWSEHGSLLEDVTVHGVPLDTLDVSLFPLRNGVVEETFWRGSFVPVRDLDGKIQGFFNRGRETTKEIIGERRTKTLNAIALPPTRGGDYVWEHLFNAFRDNEREFPMAFIYQATAEVDTGVRLRLRQSIGLPKRGHPLVPEEADLFKGRGGFCPYFRRARAADRPLLLHKSNGTLPDELVQGFEWRGFPEPSSSMAFVAINSSDRILGMMVIGLNPRRPYNVEYEGFLNSLARHVSATIVHAIDKEEATLRAERLGRQLEDSERQIREIAVHGPVGMVQVASNGKIQWANDQFYELTGHSKNEEDQHELSFVDVVDPEDQELCTNRWTLLATKHSNSTVALRLKRRWKPPAGPDGRENKEEPVWVSASAFPVLEDGELKYVAAAVTDISRFKWAEATESRNAAVAKEAKRLQENFIDIVSHEMRNPLSAITQLADGISTSFEDLEGRTDFEKAKSVLEFNIESAKTILICASHQKRIIDDVLTLSKLDSMMLSITPIIVQPRAVVESALKMFEGEFRSNEIDFESVIDSTFTELDIDWVSIDPSRLTQIFINLITNAIKFTKLEERRWIKVKASAALKRPPTIAGVRWFPTQKSYSDLTQGPEWGTGEVIFLCFEVQDTGPGLEEEEMTKLFNRFQQATSKTHIKYGGSGLGLFISRELSETQGGEIGVVSQPGKGSTFAFYIKGRRADPPNDPAKVISPSPPAPALSLLRSDDKSPQDDRLARSTSGQSSSPESPPDEHKPVLLLVEDNVVSAKVLTRQLEKAGCEVHLANHGMEAIDFLSKTRAWTDTAAEKHAVELDCVLMDAEMPIMDGLTCTRRVRQLEKEGLIIKHTNIIAITANARPEQINTVIQSGADDVMPKPFRVRELLTKIESLLAKNNGKNVVGGGKDQGGGGVAVGEIKEDQRKGGKTEVMNSSSSIIGTTGSSSSSSGINKK